jgi:hypothetical protein
MSDAPRPRPDRVVTASDDRAVSTAVTHVLAITTILISGLLVASATVDEGGTSPQSVTVRVDQPSRVSGYSYSVSLGNGSNSLCDDPVNAPPNDPDYCLVLDPAAGLEVQTRVVPVDVEGSPSKYDITVTTVSGGELEVTVKKL